MNTCKCAHTYTYALGLVAVASSFRFYLSRNDIIIASGDYTNEALNSLEQLIRRRIITVDQNHNDRIKARHRIIPDIILDALIKDGKVYDILYGLGVVAATNVTPNMAKSARPRRLLRSVINHDFLD